MAEKKSEAVFINVSPSLMKEPFEAKNGKKMVGMTIQVDNEAAGLPNNYYQLAVPEQYCQKNDKGELTGSVMIGTKPDYTVYVRERDTKLPDGTYQKHDLQQVSAADLKAGYETAYAARKEARAKSAENVVEAPEAPAQQAEMGE